MEDGDSLNDGGQWEIAEKQDEQEGNGDSLEYGAGYIKSICSASGLRLLQESTVKNAYAEGGDYGPFRLFFTTSFAKRIREWSNTSASLGKRISEEELDAFVGLQMAMSLIVQSRMKDYWSEDELKGQPFFRNTMSRDRFYEIRSALRFVPSGNSQSAVQQKLADPLWHSRYLLEEFQRRCVQIAVPTCASALDENSCCTKARTKAKSYLPSKPDKYAIRFYCIVEYQTRFLHAFFDNGSGNVSNLSPANRYANVFPDLRTPLSKLRYGDVTGATTLWAGMAAQQTQRLEAPNKKRLLVVDNFYTRNALALQIEHLTGGEMKLLGTLRANYADGRNRELLKSAMERMKQAPRNAWVLVRVLRRTMPTPGIAKKRVAPRRKASERSRKRTNNNNNSQQHAHESGFEEQGDLNGWEVSPNTGMIVWRDNKLVTFFCSDLRATPSRDIMDEHDEEAFFCVRGLVTIKRWIGEEVFHRTTLKVPTVIAAYNLFMNSVDRMDQVRSTNPTRRAEKRLSLTIFTWFLDLSVNNAFALRTQLRNSDPSISESTFRDFKISVVKRLVEKAPKRRATGRLMSTEAAEDFNAQHILLECARGVNCCLCLSRGIHKQVSYTCQVCSRGFHVNCFSMTHFSSLFKDRTDVTEALQAWEKWKQDQGHRRKSKECDES